MANALTPSWFLALPLAAATMAACNDHGARLLGPDRPLAVGAYHSLSFGDGCVAEEGFAIFCSTQVVTQMLEADSDDPSVAVVILSKDHPEGALARYPYYVLGKKAGQTSVVFKAMFDDGSIREDKLDVSVKAAETLRLASYCGGGPTPSTNVLAAVGQGAGFYVQAFAGGAQLEGWLPNAVTGDDLTDDFKDDDLMFYDWQAPSSPVVLQPQSTATPSASVDGTLTAYGPAQVTEIVLSAATQLSPATFTQPGDFYLSTAVLVHGQTPCQNLPVELHSSTPSICSGPSGETVWMADPAVGTHATVHAEGACVLGAAAVPGGPILATQTFPIFFVQPVPAGTETPGFDQPCSVEGQTACAGYDIGVCQNGYWRLKEECSLDQTCDYVPASSPGCVAGATCARCRGLQ
jgi:hypothetical protein